MEKTISLIRERIRDGNARVVTADTFGAMCSSGAFLNFGHADPPIKMEKIWLNDVEAYGGIAAVDAYIGATQKSATREESYGGAHVIEDFIAGKTVELRALSTGTDCYPRRTITTELLLENLNQAIMLNPNDPHFRMIGGGVPAFLGGAPGMVVGEGTQHSPAGGFGTLMVTADMKQMSNDYLRAATMAGYGVTLYMGLGIPIPILDIEAVRATAIRDEDIIVDVIDYGIPTRSRPSLRKVSYAELKSGVVDLNGEEVRTSSLSSFRKAREIAGVVKSWVEQGILTPVQPARPIDPLKSAMPLRETTRGPRVLDIMDRKVIAIREDEEIRAAAQKLLKGETNHLPVINTTGQLVGIVTTYDISKAVVSPGKASLVRDIMKKKVITTMPEEAVDVAVRKLEQYNISALPVVDGEKRVIGMLTAMNLGKLFGRWLK